MSAKAEIHSDLVIDKIKQNMEKVMAGKQEVIDMVLTALLAGGHILLEDVPGVGKTTLAAALAKAIGCGYNRIQFTPDTLPSDITGVSVYNMQSGEFEYKEGAIMNHVILADEINRTSPKTQASLLEAMEEARVTVDGITYELPKPFMVIATQNPVEYLGTYQLPEAQLDRFFMKLSIGYPGEQDEHEMVHRFLSVKDWKNIQPAAGAQAILDMQKKTAQIQVHKDIAAYAVSIVRETRNHSLISLGASPRATLFVIRGAQAAAYLAGREYVIPEDVLKIIRPVLAHRLVLTPEARLGRQTADKVLSSILCDVKVPLL